MTDVFYIANLFVFILQRLPIYLYVYRANKKPPMQSINANIAESFIEPPKIG